MDVLAELQWRGLISQSTDLGVLAEVLSSGPVTLYCGFDPTADSLHVGSLVPLLTLRRFQLAGHRVIALVGGATGLIGDPSGRSKERALTEGDVVADWVRRIRGQVGSLLELTGPGAAQVVDNLDWTAQLSAIEFLRDVGKHFTLTTMLAKESVSSRLGASGGLSFTEFSYLLLQAFDYLELYRRHGCRLQIGGSDQWGNITAGLDLIRRVEGGSAHALTVPLVTSASGVKFGKSEGNAVWLDPTRTSPYAFYQYWLHVDDRDVVGYLRLFTFLTREEIDELAGQLQERPAARAAQRALARAVTGAVHGPAELARVEAASRALFGRGELATVDPGTIGAALNEVPHLSLPPGPLPALVDLLVATGLVAGRGEARRTIAQGGAYLNNRRVDSETAVPEERDLLHGRYLVLRRGRQALALVDRPPAG